MAMMMRDELESMEDGPSLLLLFLFFNIDADKTTETRLRRETEALRDMRNKGPFVQMMSGLWFLFSVCFVLFLFRVER